MFRKKGKLIRRANKDERYPIHSASQLYFDPNDPFMIRKKEEAIRSLTETPIPDWVLERRVEDLVD